MRIVELLLDEESLQAGIQAISVVESPAIEEDFVALKEEARVELKTIDKEKRILMGAALIPNKPIYRRNGEDEYYIYFSQDTVRKASELFFINGNQNKATLEHQMDVQGTSVVESWIIEGEQDKSRMYGMELPVGTWMVSMKILNDELWEGYVKSGKVKGFSIEGYFVDKVEASKHEEIDADELEAEKKLKEIENVILSAMGVQLSSVEDLKFNNDDIKQFVKNIKGDIKKAQKVFAQLESTAKEAKEMTKIFSKAQDSAYSLTQGSLSLMQEFEQSAKELGIDASSVAAYKNLRKSLDDLREVQDQMYMYRDVPRI